jgi:hypothetical protein
MLLSNYSVATDLRKSVKDKIQFAKIIKGSKQNSIARIDDMQTLSYSIHRYKLCIKGCRAFWMDGKYLELVSDYNGSTLLSKPNVFATHTDSLGKVIKIGSIITFPRRYVNNNVLLPGSLIIGTVSRQSKEGTLWVTPIVVGDLTDTERREANKPIIVKHPSRALIIDNNTLTEILMFKLSH